MLFIIIELMIDILVNLVLMQAPTQQMTSLVLFEVGWEKSSGDRWHII